MILFLISNERFSVSIFSTSQITKFEPVFRHSKKVQRISHISIGATVPNGGEIVSVPANENSYFIETAADLSALVDKIAFEQCNYDLMAGLCYFNEGRGRCGENALCFTQYNGAQCICPSGFYLDQDGKTCLDIDECQEYNVCTGTFMFHSRARFKDGDR